MEPGDEKASISRQKNLKLLAGNADIGDIRLGTIETSPGILTPYTSIRSNIVIPSLRVIGKGRAFTDMSTWVTLPGTGVAPILAPSKK